MTTDNKSPPSHTPLPWIEGKEHVYGPTNLIMQAHQSGPYKRLAQCDCSDDPTDEENTRFIVRACNSHYELLDALKAICDQSDEYRKNGSPRMPEPERLYQQARSAITKATGAA